MNGHPLDPAFDVDEAERLVLDVCQGRLGRAQDRDPSVALRALTVTSVPPTGDPAPSGR